MVNRSRNMRRNRSRNRSRSRGRMMRGGEQIDAANNQKESDTMPENSWYSYMPNGVTDALNSAKQDVDSFVDQTKTEGAGLVGSVTSLLPGTAAPGAAPGAAQAPEAAPGASGSSWNPFSGGYKRSKQMRMKGGKGLGLDYYATSVNGIKVAQPTYMEYYKGGKRSRRSKRSITCRRNRRRR